MTPTPEALYLQLGRLVAEMPDLSIAGAVSDEVNVWLGRAQALVEVAGVGIDHIQFQVAAHGLDSVSVLRTGHVQTIKAILHSALARAELVD